MDLGLTEAQTMLQRGAREFLEAECPPRLVRAVEERPDGMDLGLWQRMADLGWLGLSIPEEYGGLGFSLEDQALLVEELGRALTPGPYVETCAILPRLLELGGTPALRQEILPTVAEGRLLAALAVTEREAGWEAADTQLSAQPEGDGFMLDGAKLFVPFAAASDLLIVPARVGDASDAISVFLVDRRSPGLTIEPLPSLTGFALSEVRFEGVQVPGSRRVGETGQGWPALRQALDVGSAIASAYQVGAGAAVLDLTVEYAKSRVAFGQPIGAFQAIQHKLVEMLNDLDRARLTTREAVWKLDRSLPDATFAVSIAKYLASEGLREICFEAHEVHAGVGFMVDYDLQLYYRRAKWLEQFLGHPVVHRDRVAALLIDG